MDIIKVCLTGGPCSGKTSAINILRDFKQINSYKILLVPEAATLLMSNGISHEDNETLFQEVVFKTQLFLEEAYSSYAKELGNNTLIICDRGLIDSLVYTDESEFFNFCNKYNVDNIYDRYDLVIHLVSIACDKPELYNLDNIYRRENLEEAIMKENKTKEIALKTNNNCIIGNEGDFKDKIDDLIIILSNMTAA